MRRPVCAALTLALIVVAAARADHPNTARGFDAGKPYQMNGVDNVNLFNGNLTVTIPVGQRYRVNGALGYGLTLVYSGNIWDNIGNQQILCSGSNTLLKRDYPNRRSNAGPGWVLSLGRLFPSNAWPIQETFPGGWFYETPDGALHEFISILHNGQTPPDPNLLFTRDGSYLRLKIGTADRTVEFPDGTYQVFQEMQQSTNGVWTVATSPTGVWRLTSINDRLGNQVTVQYSSSATYPEIWTINDGGRSQKVYFVAAGAPYDIELDHVTLTTFGSTTTDWTFAYSAPTAVFPWANEACNHSQLSWNLSFLTGVTVQAPGVSQSYSMLKTDGTTPNYLLADHGNIDDLLKGHLTGLRLPTGGWLEWDYGRDTFSSSDDRRNNTIYVATRRMMSKDHTSTLGTWSYTRQKIVQRTCSSVQGSYTAAPEQLAVSVTTPEQVTSVNYFSTFRLDSPPCTITSSFDPTDYSLPLTRGVTKTIGAKTWYLSQETYSSAPTLPATLANYRSSGGTLARSEWVLYDLDQDSNEQPLNSRERAHLTTYGDDRDSAAGHCGSACEYESTSRSQFDDFGHFRQESTGGNFPTGNFRTVLVHYPSRQLTDNPWLLNTYTERCVVDDGTAERTSDLAQCTGSAGPPADKTVATQFCFTASTGFLARTRTLNGADSGGKVSASTDDVITVLTANASTGNVEKEEYFGGDKQSVPVTDACTATLSSPAYTVRHTYSSGSLATSKYDGQPAPGFLSVDNDIDANTGLVSTSRDVAGQATTYQYDALGRTTLITPAGLAATKVVYTDATTSVSAKVETSTPSTGTPDLKKTSIFDDFGRPIREERAMPGNTTAARTTAYNASGWTLQVSEWETTPAHFTVFTDFDAFGRPQTIRAPDYTAANLHRTLVAYIDGSKIERTVRVGGTSGERDVKTTERYDRQKRLQRVDEPGSTSSTVYTYDPAGNLAKVEMTAGMVTQTRTFTYDKRGFLKSEQHPESGIVTYGSYDARGHVGQKLVSGSSSGFDLLYTYDSTERLTAIRQLLDRSTSAERPVKEFTFGTLTDTTNFTLGRLTRAVRHNYQPPSSNDVKVTEDYTYFNTGAVKGKSTLIENGANVLQSFAQSYAYNNLGLMSSLTYPSCADPNHPCGTAGLSSIAPTYENGLIKTVPGFATSIAYAPSGMVTQITHAGTAAVVDDITADANGLPRPAQIKFSTYDTCTPPAVDPANQPADVQIATNGSTTLSVGATVSSSAPITIQWYRVDASGPVAIGCTGTTCNTGALTVTSRFLARISNSCGAADSRTAVVTVCGAPAIAVQPQGGTVQSGGSWTMSVTANGCPPFTYRWYQGPAGDVAHSTQVGTNQSFTTPALTVTTSYWVRVLDSGNSGSADSNSAVVMVPLPQPGPLTASWPPGATWIDLTWGASAGAHHYQVQRLDHGVWTSPFDVFPTTNPPTYSDPGRAGGTTYVYRVRAVDQSGSSASPFTANDLATTTGFTTIQASVTRASYAHFEEIRNTINVVRGANNDSALTWRQMLDGAGYTTVPVPASNELIRGAHLLALRRSMDLALQAVGVGTPAYTDSLSSPTWIRAVHIIELQQRAQ